MNTSTLENEKIIHAFMQKPFDGLLLSSEEEANQSESVMQYASSWALLMPAWFKFQDEYKALWKKEDGLPSFLNGAFWARFREGISDRSIEKCFAALVEGVNFINTYTKPTKAERAIYAKQPFDGYTHRFIVQFDNCEPHGKGISLHLYSNNGSPDALTAFINENKKDDLVAFSIIHCATKEHDDVIKLPY